MSEGLYSSIEYELRTGKSLWYAAIYGENLKKPINNPAIAQAEIERASRANIGVTRSRRVFTPALSFLAQ
jgi:hypothetical protein